MDAIRADVEALAAMTRDSAGVGERAAAEWVVERMLSAGVAEARVETFRYQSTYTGAHAVHVAAGLIGAARGRSLLALAALASLELEASGRLQWVRRLLPAGEGANAVGRIAARGGAAERTLVLVAHHDAAHTGLVWHPRVVQAGASRHLRRRRVDGFMQPLALGFALAAIPFGRARAAGAALLAVGLATLADVARSPTVPGASDNASGVAVLVQLARELAADPPEATETWLVSNGCEESGMGGMAAFLEAHGARLDPQHTLVLSLDTLGAGTPIVASGEGTMLEHRYRAPDLDRVDAAADAAGLPRPERWRIGGWTDPILARFAGLPAISLLSMGPGYFPHYHHPSDTPGNVDWASVEACARLARAVVGSFAS